MTLYVLVTTARPVPRQTQTGPVHGPGKKRMKSSTNLVRDRLALAFSSSHSSIICKNVFACLRAIAHSACNPGGSASRTRRFWARVLSTAFLKSIKNFPRPVLLATQKEPGNIPRCFVALSMTFPFLCCAHKLGNTKTFLGTTACKCFSSLMFAGCWSQEIKTAENLASDPTKPGRRPPSSKHSAPHMHEAVFRGKALGGLTMSTSKSWPAAWTLSWLWLASIDQLAAPTWFRQTSSSVSSNIIFRMWYNIPFSTSLCLPDWICSAWASSTHLDTKWRALITWAALAPSTSLADCLTVAFASPKAALNSASGVHCFQAPLPFGFALASSRGCKGNMWSIVLWRPEAFDIIACHLKHCALWSRAFVLKKFCLPRLAFICLALALNPAPALPPPRPRRSPRPRRPPGPRPSWAWAFWGGWWATAIPAKSCKFNIGGAHKLTQAWVQPRLWDQNRAAWTENSSEAAPVLKHGLTHDLLECAGGKILATRCFWVLGFVFWKCCFCSLPLLHLKQLFESLMPCKTPLQHSTIVETMVAAFEKLLKQLSKYFKPIVQHIEQLFKTIVLFVLHFCSNSCNLKKLSKQLFRLLNYCQNNFVNNCTIAKTISQTIDDTLNGPLVTLHQKLLENIQNMLLDVQRNKHL